MSLVAPIWVARLPPLSDWINHTARIHILASYGATPRYGTFYEPAWGLYPNLAFDLFGVPLAHVLPAATVGKIFLSLTVVLFGVACLFLERELHGRMSLRGLVASFFSFSESFLLGYGNFVFGLSLGLLTLALLLRARKAPSAGRIAAVAVLALVTVVCHAAAFVTMMAGAVAFAAAELWAARTRGEAPNVKSSALSLAPFAPAVATFGVWLLFIADKTKDRGFSTPGTSVKLLVLSMVPTYSATIDLAVLGALALCAAAAFFFARPVRLVLPAAFAAGLLALAVFLAPADFGGGYEANGRYVVGAWVFGLLALARKEEGAAPKQLAAVGIAALVALLGRQAVLTKTLADLGREADAQIALFDKLPEGEHLGNLSFLDGRASRAQQLRERALLHTTSWAAVSRQADVPTLYAINGVQPLRHKEARFDMHRFKAGQDTGIDFDRIRADVDAALVCRAPDAVRARLLEGGESLGKVGDCELIRWR